MNARRAIARPRAAAPGRGKRVSRLRLSIQGLDGFRAMPARSTLRRWVAMALERDAGLVLRFVATREARRLHQAFRGRPYPTNVLTFDYTERPVRADIVVCVPMVRAEARAQGKPFHHHLAHLVMHGVLHAQGHDHVTPGQAGRMERRERRLLARLRIADPYA
jgi:probable rRNA maturation factor